VSEQVTFPPDKIKTPQNPSNIVANQAIPFFTSSTLNITEVPL
jgi:hypothetical protein